MDPGSLQFSSNDIITTKSKIIDVKISRKKTNERNFFKKLSNGINYLRSIKFQGKDHENLKIKV